MEISGYLNLQLRCEGHRCNIYQAQRQIDGLPVILKVLRETYPRPQEVARFRREYEITQRFDAPNIIRCYDLIQSGNQFAIALEDFGGRALNEHLSKDQPLLPLAQALSLMTRIAEAIGQAHRDWVIHRDINPSNLVWNASTDTLKLIDFGISSQLSREMPNLPDIDRIEGTLCYISPEQTGRMNRAVDYRSDFYSMGVTFYQLLTGELPFFTNDLLALVHAHIARSPSAPHLLRSEIPTPVSDIVLKLMAKNADERYQSVQGLVHDLKCCEQLWRSQGQIKRFDLGQKDFSDRLIIPQTLYGRQAEYQQLMAAFERCCQDQVEIVMVTGYSGIGKTALVKEIYQPVIQAKGEFISGKYDQFSRGEPYRPLITAITQLVQRLLSRGEDAISRYRQQLLAAVGSNASLLLELIPDFQQLIGPQPPVATTDTDTETRLHVLFRSLLQGLATAEHPLVLFIDDLQWADTAFMRLIQRLATDPEGSYLLLLGTYRNNEVHAAHPLILSLTEIRKARTEVTTLTLSPLTLEQTQQLLQETLTFSTDKIAPIVGPLADLCFKRTQGNPFFLHQLLENLYHRGWLSFSPEHREWTWDFQATQRQGIPDNVVTFLTDRLETLPQSTMDILQQAAVVGNRFDLNSLTALVELSPAQIVKQIQPALKQELIVFASDALDLATSFDFQADPSYNPSYQFLHDRVQQAAYALLDSEKRINAHYLLGQELWTQQEALTHDALDDELLFTAANHLNHAHSRLTPLERYGLAELNLKTGLKAIQAAAFQAALELLMAGVNLMPKDAWEHHYELTLRLHSEAAKAAHLAAEVTTMEQLKQAILTHAQSPLDAAPAHQVAIDAMVGQNQLNAAIDYSLNSLQQDWGQTLPSHPNDLQVLWQFVLTKLALIGKSQQQLVALPDMTSQAMRVSMRLRQGLFSSAYYARPNLLPVIALSLVRTTLSHGIGPESPMAFAVMGLVQCSLGDERGGYQLGQTACQLIPRSQDLILRNSTWHVFNTHLRFWKAPYVDCETGLREVYKQGLECGDLEYAAFAAMMYCVFGFYRGRTLKDLKQDMTTFSTAIKNLEQGTSLYTHEMYRQAVFNLTHDCDHPSRLVGVAYNEDEAVPIHQQKSDISNLFTYYGAKTFMHLILGDYEQAAAAAETNRQYLKGAVSSVFEPNYYVYDALSQAQVYPQKSSQVQAKLLKRILKNRKKVAHWADLAPMNHAHHLALIDAEIARLRQQPYRALSLYEQAITTAQHNGYLHTEALASELAGHFLMDRQQNHLALIFLRDAHYLYQQWGAQAKVERLEQQYPELHQMERSITGRPSTVSTTINTSNSQLDFESVIRSSQALSNEIVLEHLLETLMTTVIATAGAETGLLLREQDLAWQVIATDQKVSHSLSAIDGSLGQSASHKGANHKGASQPFPQTIVNYVAKTKESLVLNDATQEGAFIDDAYVQTHQPKSVLCTPLLNQGQLKGILYLENNLATSVFTPERLEVLQILSGQAAISIQNAHLYQQLESYSKTLEQRVNARTLELSQTLDVLKATQAELVVENALLRSDADTETYQYQIGGSLPMDAPTYAVRRADRQLYKALRQGQYCYILNARQMGKSSLRVQMMKRLQADGVVCAVVDLSVIGNHQMTIEQWYAGFTYALANSLNLLPMVLEGQTFRQWWIEHTFLPPVQRLGQFIETVVLTQITKNIVLFIDEIDSTLSLGFDTDDFFIWLRACFNQRADISLYQRLSVVLIGVATPSQLIDTTHHTPFNIGQEIKLAGFVLHEAQPLLYGLSDRVSNPQAVLAQVLAWTGGQPFLSQKVCQLVCQLAEPIEEGQEADTVDQLVRSHILNNWEIQDDPVHLRTIRDRICTRGELTPQLLKTYRQLSQGDAVAYQASLAHQELLLSGVVIQKDGQLHITNRIYETIFNQQWISQVIG